MEIIRCEWALRLAALARVRASSEAPALACVSLPPPSVHRGGARKAHHHGPPSVEGPEQHLSAGRGRPPRRTAAHHHHRHRHYHNYLVSLFSLRSSAEGGPELFGNICWTLWVVPSWSVSAALRSITRSRFDRFLSLNAQMCEMIRVHLWQSS